MKTMDLYRAGMVLRTLNIDEKTIFSQRLMNEHKISSDITVDEPVNLQIGDYIQFRGEKFYINRVPGVQKTSSKTFNYKIDFEGELYGLYAKLFMYEGLSEFSYTGNVSDFLTLVISCMGQISTGWSVGTVDSTTEINMQFNGDSCRTALSRIAEQFKFEFSIVGRCISMKKSIGNVTPYRFEYGKGLGLYQINREQVSDQNIVTRVYGFGGDKNIPYTYRNGAKKLVFENKFIEKNISLYGVLEGQFTNQEIYPRRTGSVTAAKIQFEDKNTTPQVKDEFYVEDSSINFDINQNLMEGKSASIVFTSGDLSGQEFEIYKATYDTVGNIKRMHFNPISDNNGYTLPNQLNQPAVGDQYALVGLSLPQSYVDDAETELLQATQQYIDQNSVPKVVYSVVTDPKFVKQYSIAISAGDMVRVVDSQLGIDSLIRVSDIRFPLVNPNKIQLTISDSVPYSVQERVIKTVVETKKETFFIDRKAEELARRNTLRQKQLKDLLFDEDQYFDTENIKPLSIESKYLSIGSKSADFILDGVTIQPNYLGDPNAIAISTGELIHRQIEVKLTDATTLNSWSIGPLSTSGLSSGSSFYLYAKCSKIMGSGVWLLTAEKKLADGEISDKADHNFYFLVGILFNEYQGARDYDFTFGMTYINGRTITTGRIRSVNKLNYFDLDQNKFMLGNSESGLDWNVTAPNRLTIRGLLFQSQSGDSFPAPVYRGVFNPSNVYYKGDQVTYNGSTYLFTSDTPQIGKLPTNASYWNITAKAGEPGLNGTNGLNGINGSDGLSVVWMGELSSAPNNPVKNWVYKNTGDGIVYIYNGAAWVMMIADGNDGVDGANGTNGLSVYITYNDNLATITPSIPTGDGTSGGWHTTPTNSSVWLSQKVSASASAGTWGIPIRIKGTDGTNGLNGTNGSNGATGDYYEYRYAKNGSTTVPPSLVVIDVSPTGWSTTPPFLSPLEYLWMIMAKKDSAGTILKTIWSTPTRISPIDGTNGKDGVNGTNGINGDYIEFQYAKNQSPESPPSINLTSLNPTGWSTIMPSCGASDYLWVTSARKDYSGSSLKTNWNIPTRSTGLAGQAGLIGATPIYRGEFDATKTYYGTTTRVDIVKYGSSYFVARTDAGSFSGVYPFDPSKWNPFGAQFESVATDLLFATLAYIDNLGVRYLRTAVSGQRVEINGDTGEMNFYNSSNQLIMSLSNGVMTAYGAHFENATFDSSDPNSTAHMGMDYQTLRLYDAYGYSIQLDPWAAIFHKTSLSFYDGFLDFYNSTFGLDYLSSINIRDSSGIARTRITSSFIQADRINLRQLNATEIASAPPFSIYVDSNGRHVAKDGNGTPHILW